MVASAPPPAASTMPKRGVTTRMPALRAALVAASHSRQTSARKPSPGTALLGEHLVPAVAVVADGRGGEEDARRALELGERSGEERRPAPPTLADRLLPSRRPAAAGDALSREMDDGVHALERGHVDRPVGRVPANVRRAGLDRAADEPVHAMSSGLKEGGEAPPDQPRGPGDRDAERPASDDARVARQIGVRARVAEAEHALEHAPHRPLAEPLAERPAREPVDDPVLEHAPGGVGENAMGMAPLRERPGDLHVAELAPGLVVAVHRLPAHPERPAPHREDEAPAVLDAALTLDDLDLLPGRREALERPGARVPGEDRLRRQVESAPVDELGHRASPGLLARRSR